MSKDEARTSVAGLLRSRPLTIYPHEQPPGSKRRRLRIVADAGRSLDARAATGASCSFEMKPAS